MASQVRILPTINENSVLSLSHLLVSCPPWWNSNEHRVAQLIPRDTGLKKVEGPSQHYHDTKHSVLRSPEHEPTPARAINRFHRGASGDESCGKDIEDHMNSVFLLSNHNTLLSPFYPNYNHSTAFAQYPCVDDCFSGLFTSHGQHAITQVTGATPKRIPLPLDVAEDEPVYVNAKQYHGILRRRQHRAKLEMQNKLVKSRKPYLHESRHLHALNRVRGSGGRFLSKKLQQPEPTSKNSHCILDRKNRSELNSCRLHTVGHGGSSTNCSDISSISNNDGDFQ